MGETRPSSLAAMGAMLLLTSCFLTLDFEGISDGKSTATVPRPIAFWPFDESSGLTAADVNGSHDGTLVVVASSPRFTSPGRHGGALSFSDGKGALTVASLSNASFPRRGALAIWTRADGLPVDRRLIFAARGKAIRPLELALERDRFVWASAGSAQASFIDGVTSGKWFLVVAMWDVDAKTRALYAREDGGRGSLVQGEVAADLVFTDATFELEHPSGAIDETRLFDRVLVRAELDAID